MTIQLSPGVNVSEIDLTTVVPSVSTSDGAIAGLFRWGPVGVRTLVSSETSLASLFGTPTSYNAETFFTAANFLAYSSSLYVSRAANTSGATPVVTGASVTSGSANVTVTNTANLSVGMYVTQITNSGAFNVGQQSVITSITNSTSFVMSSNSGVTNTSISIYFGQPQVSYTALAFDPGTPNTYVSNLAGQIVTNSGTYANVANANFASGIAYVAKYPGAIGNSLRVSVCDSVNAYSSNVTLPVPLNFVIGNNIATAQFSSVSNTSANAQQFSVGDKILAGNSSIGFQYLQLTSAPTVNTNYNSNTLMTFTFSNPYRLHTVYVSNTVQRFWEFWNVVNTPPTTSQYVTLNGNTSAVDQVHVVVVDNNGQFTGTPGTILETFKGLSRATDAMNPDGTTNFYQTVINSGSAYIWWANDRLGASSANAALVASSSNQAPANMTMALGADGYNETNANNFATIATAYNLFASAEDVDISLVMQGYPLGPTGSTYQLANYIIDNIVSIRKDCVAFISPDKSLVLNAFNSEATNIVGWTGSLHSSTYAVVDSGYKYQYDKYNDVYRWIPLNGDIAGLCARTDQTNDAWWSPAGFNRGQIKNLVKLAWNPNKPSRDVLFKNAINPVVAFPGIGTVLYGDHTFTAQPSAFDRINVRRLFIVLEKAISTAAKYSLFEFNDAFSRAQFKNLITPYLRTIQGRRGITDFLVVCDETNNTGAIIDSNQFVGDIYIKPARSINFIQLNFVAVGTSVEFSTVVGQF